MTAGLFGARNEVIAPIAAGIQVFPRIVQDFLFSQRIYTFRDRLFPFRTGFKPEDSCRNGLATIAGSNPVEVAGNFGIGFYMPRIELGPEMLAQSFWRDSHNQGYISLGNAAASHGFDGLPLRG